MENKEQNFTDIEIVTSGLRFLRKVLTPVGGIFSEVKAEFEKLIADPVDIRKGIAIAEQRLLYEQFGNNPLHAWKAIEIWQESDFKEVPQWAVFILAKSAKEMTVLRAVEGTVDSNIKKALGIDGHKIGQFEDNIFWLEAFHETHGFIQKGMTQKNAFLSVAERYSGKISEAAVEKRYFAFKSKLMDIPLPSAFEL